MAAELKLERCEIDYLNKLKESVIDCLNLLNRTKFCNMSKEERIHLYMTLVQIKTNEEIRKSQDQLNGRFNKN